MYAFASPKFRSIFTNDYFKRSNVLHCCHVWCPSMMGWNCIDCPSSVFLTLFISSAIIRHLRRCRSSETLKTNLQTLRMRPPRSGIPVFGCAAAISSSPNARCDPPPHLLLNHVYSGTLNWELSGDIALRHWSARRRHRQPRSRPALRNRTVRAGRRKRCSAASAASFPCRSASA